MRNRISNGLIVMLAAAGLAVLTACARHEEPVRSDAAETVTTMMAVFRRGQV